VRKIIRVVDEETLYAATLKIEAEVADMEAVIAQRERKKTDAIEASVVGFSLTDAVARQARRGATGTRSRWCREAVCPAGVVAILGIQHLRSLGQDQISDGDVANGRGRGRGHLHDRR
jgi:hypothetical protein